MLFTQKRKHSQIERLTINKRNKNNQQVDTKQMQSISFRKPNRLRLRSISQQGRSIDNSRMSPTNIKYNKYYIPPSLRYRQQAHNPKDDPESYNDEDFIYNNLHNNNFWNWAHPLQEYSTRPNSNAKVDLSSKNKKINLPALQKFKQYVEQRTKKRRLPLVVTELLSQLQ